MKALLILLVTLTGCAHITYEGQSPDGNVTKADVWEFFHTESVSGFSAHSDKEGREITLDKGKFGVDSAAIGQANQALGVIVGTALKVYMGKP